MSQFDEAIDRRGQHSVKWGKFPEVHAGDAIPMWVADMDFRPPQAVTDAMREQLEHGVFGYSLDPIEGIVETTVDYLAARFGWNIQADWLVWLPCLVAGFNHAARVAGERGDEVACATPIYPPMKAAPANAERDLLSVPMKRNGDRWVLDLDAFRANITPKTRMLLFCNPHNPGGTVYTREELEELYAITHEHDLLVCSDEIQCDLILDETATHTPYATLNEDAAQRSITLMAASKTFNVAGLSCGFAVIPDAELRERFRQSMRGVSPDVNIFGMLATRAAFREGAPWREELLDYLRGNLDLICQLLGGVPGIRIYRPQASFLIWMDVSEMGLEDPPEYFKEYGVAFSPGEDFGDPNFVRMNFGCTRDTLREALGRIRTAVEALPRL